MIFWILVALAVLLIVGMTVTDTREQGQFDGIGLVGRFFAVTGLAAVAWGLALLVTLIAVSAQVDVVSRHTHTESLRALSVDSTIHGSFFLGTGYVDGVQSFTYIESHPEGYATVETAPARTSTVWEDGEASPHVDVTSFYVQVWWVAPAFDWEWDFWLDNYDFHIPAGSVMDQFSVDVND